MSRAGVARRVARVEAALDLCIARARALGLRMVRHAFETPEGDPTETAPLGVPPGVCALAAYKCAAPLLVDTGIFADGGTSLDLSKRNLGGEWDAIEEGWDGTPWQDARAAFRSTKGSSLSRAFYDLGVRLAAKHHPEDP